MVSPDPVATPGMPPPNGSVVIDRRFTADALYAVRAELSAHAAELGAGLTDLERMVIVASELATNAIRHGGGSGRLRLWGIAGRVHCQVSDQGGGLIDGGPAQRPDPNAVGGRGLWLCRELADALAIETGPDGTTITATFQIGP